MVYARLMGVLDMVYARSTSLVFASLFVLIAGTVHGADAPSPRTDLYGDPLPPGAVVRLGTSRLRQAGVRVAFSKDGKRLISCGADAVVCVWDAATGRLVRRTRLNYKPRELANWVYVTAVFSLTPDGATAVAWDGDTVYVFDTATGRERGHLLGTQVAPGNPHARMLALSPDGKKMAMSWWGKEGEKGFTQLLDIDECKKHLNLEAPPHTVNAAAFTPDGKQLAAAVGKDWEELVVWDAVTGKLRQRKKFRPWILSLAYTPDGATLAVGRAGSVKEALFLLDAATLNEKAALPARGNDQAPGFIDPVAVSPDGRLLAGGYGDGRLFGELKEQGLLIWDPSGSKTPRWLPTPKPHSLAFAPDGKTVAGCTPGSNTIDLWDVDSGRRLHQLPCHDTLVSKMAVSPDGKILASSDSKPAIRLWDTATGKPLRSLAGWDAFGSACLIFSADGRWLISVSRHGKLQMWEVVTGKELCRFAIDSPGAGVYPGYSVALFDGGKRLAAVASIMSAQLSIWDTATGKEVNRRSLSKVQPTPRQGNVELAPDGESATVWQGDRLTIEDISTKTLLATLPKGLGNPLGFSPDGRLLAVFLQPRIEHMWPYKESEFVPEAYDVKGLLLIETATGQEVVRLDIRRFDHVAFTPDSRALVVTDQQKLSVWDTATGERLHQMEWPEGVRDGHGHAKITSLVALPGGQAATGMTEGDILIWDLAPSTWPVRPPARELSSDQLDALWSDLARDARSAYRAASLLAAAPGQSVPLLTARVHPVAVDSKRIEKLIGDLDAEQYPVRESASHELKQLLCASEPPMRRALADKPTLEMRRRLENILAEPKHPKAEALRMRRAIAVLERIGTPEARRILEKLAGGAAAPETRAAQAALERLKYRAESVGERSTP